MDLQDVKARVTQHLVSADERLLAAYLYGSVAQETARATSDVDVAILLRGDSPEKLMGLRFSLEGALETALGRRVQVIVLNRAPVDLVHRVLRDGHLLLDRDPSTRVRFEVKSRNEYFDLLPILQRYRKREAAAP
jgi:predicted nucleotidyltransferase